MVKTPTTAVVRRAGLVLLAVLFVAAVAFGGYLAYEQIRIARLAGTVRALFAARRYADAQQPLERWLVLRPDSGEAIYYKAWAALAADQPAEAAPAIDRARKIGFDSERLHCLAAIGQSRSKQFNEAEPVLDEAFRTELEPRSLIAQELARIYLSTYRLDQAAVAIERWRELEPENPQPYLWSNEIASRSDAAHAVIIANYRAALERDPTLDKARLGLAQELSADRRFDEAKQEFLTYLKSNPDDPIAHVGLGRNAFQVGQLEEAIGEFEAALLKDPRQPDALKELGQIDLRLGRFPKACERLRLLTQVDPFDYQVRYAFARSLKLAGDETGARDQAAHADRLRKDHDQIMQLRYELRKRPDNLEARVQIARWLLEHGHDDEGLKWTQEVLRADPVNVPTHRLLADYYSKRPDSAGLANYHRLRASAGAE
jgi:tetratricopeptide (TPR) repeat protein